jgi:hypothetical protein
MTVSQNYIETLRKALAASTKANGAEDRGRDEETTGRCSVSVSELSDKALESALQKLLEMLHRETPCRFNIGVRGAPDTTELRIHIWSNGIWANGMSLMSSALPEDFGGDVAVAILQTLTNLVEDFRMEPKWKKSPNPQGHRFSARPGRLRRSQPEDQSR